MKHIDQYRNRELINRLVLAINQHQARPFTFMEVCGGHTMAIHRFGIDSLLAKNFRLISGPGCPVCVTSKGFIDNAIALSRRTETIIATFGDLMRVPGTSSTLEREKALGADIRMVFSPSESLIIALDNPSKSVVFLAIGFETTSPGTAIVIKEANRLKPRNFHILSAHKVMPPAMEAIVRNGVNLDGFICPGHVSTITGSNIFNFLPEKHRLGCVVTGFEPLDLLQSIFMLVKQVEGSTPRVEIQYARAVKPTGNLLAQKYLAEVFNLADDWWRGFGIIPKSGLKLKDEYSAFDAEKAFNLSSSNPPEDASCICGDILRGHNAPTDCPLFAKVCQPDNPVGACMVSSEGACHAHFKYKRYELRG